MRETRPQMPQPVIVYICLFIYLYQCSHYIPQTYAHVPKTIVKIAHVDIMYAPAFHCHCSLLEVFVNDKEKQFLSQ